MNAKTTKVRGRNLWAHRWTLMAVLPGLAAAAPAPATTATPPNIVFIMADDLGYSDLGCFGGEIETPVLDRLAANSLRFSRFYNSARCWPSRTALITGYYPRQTNTDPLEKGASLPGFVRPLPAFLHPHGYRSYHSGKWHVRPAPETVLSMGFERSFNVLDYNRFFSPKNNTLDDVPLPVPSDPDYYDTIETRDLAGQHPELLQTLVQRWEALDAQYAAQADSATMAEPLPAMPCYLGGEPNVPNFARCFIRNATVEMVE
jgi:arylsulfatase A-like enzyme